MSKQTDRIGVAALAALALGGGGLSALDLLGGGRRTHGGGTNQSSDAVDFPTPTQEQADAMAMKHWRDQKRGRLTNSQKRAVKREGSEFRLAMEEKYGHEFGLIFGDLLGDERA